MTGNRKAPKHWEIDQKQQKYNSHDDERFSPRAVKYNDVFTLAGQYQNVQEYPFCNLEEQTPGERLFPEN